jgi:DNA-binding transcriptional MerR regulator
MSTFDPNRYLTLDELLERIEAARSQYASLKGLGQVPDRTVRFYAEQGLLPNVARGRGKKYPADFVWKILFIRLLTQLHQLKLSHIGLAMRQVDVETMRRVVTGEEPLEVAVQGDDEAVARHTAKGHKIVEVEPVKGREDQSAEKDGQKWTLLLDRAEVVLRVRADLPAAKQAQLKHIASLIKSIVEGSDAVQRTRRAIVARRGT